MILQNTDREVRQKTFTVRRKTSTRAALKIIVVQRQTAGGELVLPTYTISGKFDSYGESPRYLKDFCNKGIAAAELMQEWGDDVKR